jgi:hypothetical protein
MKLDRQMLAMYKAAAQAAIGERTSDEIAYDKAVIDGINRGLSTEDAIAHAGVMYPEEALQITDDNRADILARFDFLKEHEKLMRMLRTQGRR